MDINTIIITGNLVSDPVTEYTTGGTAVWKSRIATGTGKDKDTLFVNIKAFGKPAEWAAQDGYSKGDKIFVQGQLLPNNWKTREGQPRTEIYVRADRLMISRPKGTRDMRSSEQAQRNSVPMPAFQAPATLPVIDELPTK